MSLILNAISQTAFSFTLSGNSGISPFLTMLLIGITQRISPESFNMSELMEKIMSSTAGLALWGTMTVLEFVGKCVPVIDQMVDSVEVFVVPWISTLGSCASFGSSDASDDEAIEDQYGDGNINDGNADDNLNEQGANMENENLNEENGENPEGDNADGERLLRQLGNKKVLRGRTLTASSSAANATRMFFQVILVLCGMVLALCLHFCKMIVRLLGTGCLTQIITVAEALTVILGVVISVFIRQFAIVIAALLCLGAFHGAKGKYEKWRKEEEGEGADKTISGRFKRFFNHKHKNDKDNTEEKEDSYIQMEDHPKS